MPDRQRWILEQFARKLAESSESMVGSRVSAEVASALQERTPSPDDLAWEQSFDSGPGRLIVVAPSSAWEKIGGDALKSAGVDELDRDSVRGTYLEILSQAFSGTASEIGGRLERNVSPVDGRELESPPSQVHGVNLTIEDATITLFVSADPALVAQLHAPPPSAPESTPGSAGDSPMLRQDSLDGSKTLDLLLDVELPVSVSFGRASVPLKDVLKLTSGSIVELNRGVSDPVELIVNNCVIARGEVVVVEGNYGVRIQQIVSAGERLRTLN